MLDGQLRSAAADESAQIAPPSAPHEGKQTRSEWDQAACLALIDELWVLRQELLEFEGKLGEPSEALKASARNLAHYIALRRKDRRHLQLKLASLGLSSLGHAESHVLANVDKVLGILHRLTHQAWSDRSDDEPVGINSSRRLLEQHSVDLLGPQPGDRAVRIMVTLPSEAASDFDLVEQLVVCGMNIARINCAHDDADKWRSMAEHVRNAARAHSVDVRILMDLGGPKLRTGEIAAGPDVLKLQPRRDAFGIVVAPARVRLIPTAPTTPGDEIPAIGVDPEWLLPLRQGDLLTLTDARGSDRVLTVADVAVASVIAETDRSTYIVPGIDLRRERKGTGARRGEIRGVPETPGSLLLRTGDLLRITASGIAQPFGADNRSDPRRVPSIACTLPEVFGQVRTGERIFFDDGHIGGVIREASTEGLTVQIVSANLKGSRLAGDKGINLPDSKLELPALTGKDIEDLEAVARHADLVGLSFVQRPRDVEALHAQLKALKADHLGVVLKIETRRAFERLPELMLAAMHCRSAGVMIARGDLAVECGYERLAEVQEEILWAAEAAHMPVIWATQVLETLAKTGQPSRAEITDAAMGERAECVMLNKGPHILEAIRTLDDILKRMQSHQSKKRALLRALSAWSPTR